jgi:hypothetical protein
MLYVGSRETMYQIALTLSSGVPRLIEMPEPKPSALAALNYHLWRYPFDHE